MSASPQQRLLSFCAHLRRNGFRIAVDQVLSAAWLVHTRQLSFEAGQAYRSTAQLAGIFCKSARDQRRYQDLAANWSREGSHLDPGSITNPKQELKGTRWNWVLPAVFAACVACIALGLVAASQLVRTRDFTVQVIDTEDKTSRPVAGASVKVGDCAATTDARGAATCRLRAIQFPLDVAVAKGGQAFPSAKAAPGWREVLLARDLAPFKVERIRRTAPLASDGGQAKLLISAGPTIIMPEPWAESPAPPAKLYAAGIATFLCLVYLAGEVWLRRSAVLERRRAPLVAGKLTIVGGAPVSLARTLRAIRAFALTLRQPVRGHGRALDVRRTVESTARRAGLFTPQYGQARERRFLAFLRRQSLQDHEAFLGEAMIAELFRSGADILAFRFDTDANVLEPYFPVLRDGQKISTQHGQSYPTLEQVLAANEQAEALVFCEPAGMMEPATGGLAGWSASLLNRDPLCTIFSVAPPSLDDPAATLLAAGGARLSALDAFSLWQLAEPGGGGAADRMDGGQPPGVLTSEFQLDRPTPKREEVAAICTTIRSHMGDLGFRWVQACAIYPNIQWALTNAVGRLVVRDDKVRERLLFRLSQMVWFRKAYMPDWLRSELVHRLDRNDALELRAFYWQLLDNREGYGNITLDIAADGAERRASRWRDWLARLRMRQGLRARLHGAGREQVFIRFLLRLPASPLAMTLPRRILARVMETSRAPRALLATFCVAGVTIAGGAAVAVDHTPAQTDGYAIGIGYQEKTNTVLAAVTGTGAGAMLASATVDAKNPGWTFHLWQLDLRKAVVAVAPDDDVFAAFIDGGKTLHVAGGGRSNTVDLDFSAGDEQWLAIGPVAQSGRHKGLYVNRFTGKILGLTVFDAPGDSGTTTFMLRDDIAQYAKSFAIDRDGRFALLNWYDKTSVIALAGKMAEVVASTTVSPDAEKVTGIAVDPAASPLRFAECLESGTIRVWEYPGQGQLRLLNAIAPHNRTSCTSLAFAQGGELIAVGQSDGTVELVNRSTGESTQVPLAYGGSAAVADLRFSTSGTRLLVGRKDRSLSVAEIVTETPGRKPDERTQQFEALRRAQILVTYFEKPSDPKGIAEDLQSAGYRVMKTKSGLAEEANTVWFGCRPPLTSEDAQRIATILIRRGVKIRNLDMFVSPNKRQTATVEIGADTGVVERPAFAEEAAASFNLQAACGGIGTSKPVAGR